MIVATIAMHALTAVMNFLVVLRLSICNVGLYLLVKFNLIDSHLKLKIEREIKDLEKKLT